MTTVVRVCWRSGNGDPYNGGLFGVETTTTVDGFATTVGQNRPADAVTIDEAEFEALRDAWAAEWSARAIGGQEFVDAETAALLALRESAATNLVAGAPLTPAEAAALAGTPAP